MSPKAEVAVVEDRDGKREEIDVLRENTRENAQELEGSTLPENDRGTPARRVEVDEEAED